MYSKKIVNRLLFWFLSLSLVPLIVVSIISNIGFEESLRQQVHSQLLALTDSKAQQLETYIRERQKNILVLANTPDVVEALQQFTTTIHRNDINQNHYNTLRRTWLPYFSEYVETSGYENLLLIAASGEVVFTVRHEGLVGLNYAESPYRSSELGKMIDRAQTLLQSEISNFEMDPLLAQTTAYIAAPIIQERELLGVVVVQINNHEIQNIINDTTSLHDNGEVVVGLRRNEQIEFPILPQDLPNLPDDTSPALLASNFVPLQQATQGIAGHDIVSDYRGNEVIAAWQYLPSLRWGLVVKMNTAEAFATIETQRWGAIILMGITLLMVLAVVWMVTKTITEPILNLTLKAQRIAQGEWDDEVPVATHDEIGQLAQSFNEMIVSLQKRDNQLTEYANSLEGEVQERKEAELALREKLEMIENQRLMIRELSTPVIPIMERIIVVPLVGKLDADRASDLMRKLLIGIREYRAKIVILDITGVSVMDDEIAAYLDKTIQAARLKGARTIVTGISNPVAETIIELGLDWRTVEAQRDLRSGLMAALRSMGVKIERNRPSENRKRSWFK